MGVLEGNECNDRDDSYHQTCVTRQLAIGKTDNDKDCSIQLLKNETKPKSDKYEFDLGQVFPQIIYGCVAHCLVIQAGINMAYSTTLIDGLNGEKHITKDQESWIASLATISLPCGSFFVGPLMDKFGRKKICQFCLVPMIVSWTTVTLAQSLLAIYVARFTAGFAAGLTTVGLVYVSEISHPRIRPMMLSLNSVFVSLGILITCCLAYWFSWRNLAMIFLILHCCLFFLMCVIPESPYWVSGFESSKPEKVQRIVKILNRSERAYEEELGRIQEVITNDLSGKSQKSQSFSKEFRTPAVYKPIVLLVILFLVQQLSGTYAVIFYAIQIFERIGGERGRGVDKYRVLVILGIVRFTTSVIVTVASRYIGRRSLLMVSGLGMALTMFSMATLMHVAPEQHDLLLAILIMYVCLNSVGFIMIPWTLIGELLPISVKGSVSGILVAVAYLMMFSVTKSLAFVDSYLGYANLFVFFGFSSLVGIVVVYVFLPETLGRSFHEIKQYFDETWNFRCFSSEGRV